MIYCKILCLAALATAVVAQTGSESSGQALWGQCGGLGMSHQVSVLCHIVYLFYFRLCPFALVDRITGYTGPTVCKSPGTCCFYNNFESQCLPPNYSCPDRELITSTTESAKTTTTTSTTATSVKPTTTSHLVPVWAQCGGQGKFGTSQICPTFPSCCSDIIYTELSMLTRFYRICRRNCMRVRGEVLLLHTIC